APGFWELVHASRCVALDAAAKHGVPLLVTTYCYVPPHDLSDYEEFEAIVRRHGGEIHPVFLHCPREEVLRRIGNPDRAARGKLTSAEGLVDFVDGRDFTSVPRQECITFDTGAMRPDAVARAIVDRFGLAG